MKTQKINRKDLFAIWSTVCAGWQKKISEVALVQSGDQIEVSDNLIFEAYEAADSDQKKWLKNHFTIVSNKITDRIKLWSDVLKEAGKTDEEVVRYSNPKNKEERSDNGSSRLKLLIKILNEDWTADFNNRDQPKYYLFFEKKASGWVVNLVDYRSYLTVVGFGFHFKNRELALYAFSQFPEIFADYLP